MDADETPTPAQDPATSDVKPRRRGRKVLIGLLACVVALAVIVGGTGFYLQNKLDSQLTRIPGAFEGLKDRPARASGEAGKALNILLMGSDKRDDVADETDADDGDGGWVPGLQRSDTLMVLHVAADRKSATIVSIPRDSWVDVPGYGKNKINAAFSLAGPSLTVATVEKLTNLRIDHVMVVDWDGFRAITDTLGGVQVTIPEKTYDSARKKTWEAGRQTLDGKEALLYVRQRYGLPGGDFDRVKRQQNFLRAMMQKAGNSGALSSPTRLYALLDSVTPYLTIDEEWSTGDLRSLALSLRGLRSNDIDFATVPIRGTGREGAQSVVYLDQSKAKELWGAMLADDPGTWLEANPGGNLPSSTKVS
ncbi:LCP family protein [Solicola sp. PLA-1-18]|uniref:LCP family protein n=1 Tax=Solicola sp. PLA-1-18 TaxID=3380532 RepID=UPI003B78C23B